jgi:hypothetical protein
MRATPKTIQPPRSEDQPKPAKERIIEQANRLQVSISEETRGKSGALAGKSGSRLKA